MLSARTVSGHPHVNSRRGIADKPIDVPTPCDFLLLTGRKWAADYHRRVGTRRCLFWTDSNDFRLSLQSSEAL
jgi:hypothetical protein